jgi:hypothetical protein
MYNIPPMRKPSNSSITKAASLLCFSLTVGTAVGGATAFGLLNQAEDQATQDIGSARFKIREISQKLADKTRNRILENIEDGQVVALKCVDETNFGPKATTKTGNLERDLNYNISVLICLAEESDQEWYNYQEIMALQDLCLSTEWLGIYEEAFAHASNPYETYITLQDWEGDQEDVIDPSIAAAEEFLGS